MDCYECGGTYIKKTDLYEVNDPYVGIIGIKGVPYYQCNNCKDILFSDAMAQAIESKRKEKIDELLNQYPINSFINASETASLLGISRQALHKNHRIKRGFIYQTKFCGVNVYLKQSVLQYRDTGDGRFSLFVKDHNVLGRYSVEMNVMQLAAIYNERSYDLIQGHVFNKYNSSLLKEYNYASQK